MSVRPIVLFTPKATLASDDACTTIIKYTLAPPPSSANAPYLQDASSDADPLPYVPPLTYFCIKAVVEYPDQVHALGPARLRYSPPEEPHDFDILQALIPTYRPFSPDHPEFDLRVVDPRLWAVLAQIYEELPPAFRQYTLPLSDTHLPLLQTIPSTEHFSLITVLSLARCKELTDDTAIELRHLHTLTAFDASATALGSWGVQRLAKTLTWSEGDDEHAPERRGPWGLRVLYLRNCMNVDDTVFGCLSRFPLLSVVDLRGTPCKPWKHQLPFQLSSDYSLFDPGCLSKVLGRLSTLTQRPRTLFSHHTPYLLNVNTLHHKVDMTPAGRRLSPVYDPASRNLQKGRTDVFLPYEPSRQDEARSPDEEPEGSQSPEGTASTHRNEKRAGITEEGSSAEEQSTQAVNATPHAHAWMNEVAEHESAVNQRQRAVDRFYALPSLRRPRTLSSHEPRIPHDAHETSISPSPSRPKDPLMLFRPPPPWSVLPTEPPLPGKPSHVSPSTMPSSVFSSASGSPAHRPSSGLKRKASSLSDAAGTPGPARKRMHALSSIQSMFSMVQNRAKPAQAGSAHAATPPSWVTVNPFARVKRAATATTKASKDASGCEKSADPGPVASPRRSKLQSATSAGGAASPATRRRATMGSPKTVSPAKRPTPAAGPPMENVSASISASASDSPRPAKKLKPISTLTVPDWPTHLKPLSAHQPRPVAVQKAKQARLPPARRSTTTTGQERASGSGKGKMAARRLSGPGPSGDNQENEQGQDAEGEQRDPGKLEKTRSKSGGKEKEARRTSTLGRSEKLTRFDWKGWSAG